MKKMRIILFCIALFVYAKPGAAQPEFDDDVQDTPIDGGVIILGSIAAFYGVRSSRKRLESKD